MSNTLQYFHCALSTLDFFSFFLLFFFFPDLMLTVQLWKSLFFFLLVLLFQKLPGFSWSCHFKLMNSPELLRFFFLYQPFNPTGFSTLQGAPATYFALCQLVSYSDMTHPNQRTTLSHKQNHTCRTGKFIHLMSYDPVLGWSIVSNEKRLPTLQLVKITTANATIVQRFTRK